MGRLDNKVAIITGGASGIGEATVEEFVKEGAKVVIADIGEQGKDLADKINESGQEALFVKTDVTVEDDIINLVDQTVDRFGQLDIMFANAGIAKDGEAADLSYDDWKKTIDTNLSGVFLSDKYAVKQFLKQDTGGVIVNSGSIHSFVSLPNPTAYSAAKGGVKLLTQNICTAYADKGVRVNAVCPGYVRTALLDEVDEETLKELQALHPQGRWELQKRLPKSFYSWLVTMQAMWMAQPC